MATIEQIREAIKYTLVMKQSHTRELEDALVAEMAKVLFGRDEQLQHPAIVGYKSIARANVPVAWRSDVIQTVGDKEQDVYRWLALVKSWVGKGWNKMNVEGMLEAYRAGGIQRRNGKAQELTDVERRSKYTGGEFADFIEH